MPEQYKTMVAAIVRHVITTAGGGLVASGTISGSDLELLGGGAAVLVGVIWSLVQKWRAA